MENNNAPTFFYNQNKDPDPNQKAHFFVTQSQTLLVAILVTGLMQLSNHLAIYLIICCPIYFFIIIMQYYIFWKPKQDLTDELNTYNAAMFIICFPIFFGVFFSIFHPTASIEFQKVDNCQMVGKLKDWIEWSEKYSILYINFEYKGQQYLGQACASNQNQGDTTSSIYPYKFYHKYDSLQCGSDNTNFTDTNDSRLLLQQQKNNISFNNTHRFLAAGGGGGGGHGGGGGGHGGGGGAHGGGGGGGGLSGCTRSYLWSNVKIASWLCMPNEFNISQYTQPQSCYVNFLGGEKAIKNGIERAPMRSQQDFPLISYQEHAYYPTADLICLIIFTYYNWILSFNSIFQYTSNAILRKLRIFKVIIDQNLQNQNNNLNIYDQAIQQYSQPVNLNNNQIQNQDVLLNVNQNQDIQLNSLPNNLNDNQNQNQPVL